MPVEQPRIVAGAERPGVRAVERVGIDQKLRDQVGTARVAAEQADHGGEVATSAVAADREPGRVDTDVRAVPGDPAGGGMAVLHRGGEPVLGRQPVADRDNGAGYGVRERAADAVGGVDAAEGPAATEEVDQCGLRAVAL